MTAGTLVKGLQLITLLAAKPSESSLTELAVALEIDKSTVHRILAVMATMGFVEKNQATKLYSIGPQFRALAAPSYGQIQQIALPSMRSLAESTGVTVALRIREGKQMVVVDRVENNDLLRVSFPIGFSHPISFGSAGKAFLAFLPKNEAIQLLLGSDFLTKNRNHTNAVFLLEQPGTHHEKEVVDQRSGHGCGCKRDDIGSPCQSCRDGGRTPRRGSEFQLAGGSKYPLPLLNSLRISKFGFRYTQ